MSNTTSQTSLPTQPVTPYMSYTISPVYVSATLTPQPTYLPPSQTPSPLPSSIQSLQPRQQDAALGISYYGWLGIAFSIGIVILCNIIHTVYYYKKLKKEKERRRQLEMIKDKMSHHINISHRAVRDVLT